MGGEISKDELIKLMTDLDSFSARGQAPTDESVDFILKMADKSEDGLLNVDELGEAIVCWLTFMEKREEFSKTLTKYDTSGDGKLSKEELKAYLTDVNGGKMVTDEEVDMVFKEADVVKDGNLSKLELQRATSLWYSHVEEKKD